MRIWDLRTNQAVEAQMQSRAELRRKGGCGLGFRRGGRHSAGMEKRKRGKSVFGGPRSTTGREEDYSKGPRELLPWLSHLLHVQLWGL